MVRKRQMDFPGRLVTTASGIRVFVVDEGTGDDTVVFIHGYALSHISFRFQIEHFRNSRRVIAIDLPGFGESDRPKRFSYDWFDYLHVLCEVLSELTPDPFHLVGHSMGGALSMLISSAGRQPVKSMALIAPYVFSHSFQMPRALIGSSFMKFGMKHIPRALFDRFMRVAYARKSVLTRNLLDYYWEKAERPGSHSALHGALKTLSRPSAITSALPDIRVPSTVIWGDLDAMVPVRHARVLAERLGDAPLHVIEGAGHCVHEEYPDEVNSILEKWWDSI